MLILDAIRHLGYRVHQIPPVASASGREAAHEAASAFLGFSCPMKTYVYVDGFNLGLGCLSARLLADE